MSSQEPQPVWAEMSPQGPPPQPPSGSGKIWMGLGIGCGVVLLLCCGIGGFIFYKFRNVATTDPVKVRETSDSIALLNLPPEFQPLMAINFFVFKMAMWQGAGGNAMCMLMEFSPDAAQGQTEEQMLAQMEQQLQSQGQGQQVQVVTSEEVQVTIRGEERTFQFNRGTAQNTNQEVWQVMGSFQGNVGPAIVMFIAPTDQYEEDDIIEILEGIE